MDSQRAIERLEEQQAKIITLLASAGTLLGEERPDSVSALATLRWRLVRTMREYQLFKHFEIFDPLAASSNTCLADIAQGMKARCVAIGEEYAAHVQRWSNGTASNAWSDLTLDTLEITAKIRKHLDHEHAQAVKLLRNVARTRRSLSHISVIG